MIKLLTTLITITSFNLFAAVEGTFPRISKVTEDHVLKEYTVKEIEEFIFKTSKDGHKCNDHYHDDYTQLDDTRSSNIIGTNDLAKQIYKTSIVMGIDAGMLSALIYKESQFCNFGGKIGRSGLVPTTVSRASSTGAQGLGQFTSIAVRGITDQLFRTDKDYFHFKVRPNLHRGLFQLGFAETYPEEKDDSLYYKNRVSLKDKLYQSLPKTKTELKNPSKWKEQILYSAIHLKINISKRARPTVFTKENDIKHYRYTIEEYNGADLKQRTQYWNYIFSAYNDYFDDTFRARAKKQGITFSSKKWNDRKKSIGL